MFYLFMFCILFLPWGLRGGQFPCIFKVQPDTAGNAVRGVESHIRKREFYHSAIESDGGTDKT